MINSKRKNYILLFLITLLIILLGTFVYWYKFVYLVEKEESSTNIETLAKTDLAMLYFLETDTETNTVSLGIYYIENDSKKYKIFDLPLDIFKQENLEEFSSKTFPLYISISKEKELFILNSKNQDTINTSIKKDFDKKAIGYMQEVEKSLKTSDFIKKFWILADSYANTDDSTAKSYYKDYMSLILNTDTNEPVISLNDLGEGDEYTYNYGRNYLYSCFISKRIAESKIVEKNYDDQFCNLPTINPISEENFPVDNIETLIMRDNFKIFEKDTIYSTTLLIDYWSKGVQNLEDVYHYSLNQAFKFGLTREDYCYWMLVNDLTQYKNNVYVSIIHNEILFNKFNNVYCPSLHLPLQFKYLKNPRVTDISYFVYDL